MAVTPAATTTSIPGADKSTAVIAFAGIPGALIEAAHLSNQGINIARIDNDVAQRLLGGGLEGMLATAGLYSLGEVFGSGTTPARRVMGATLLGAATNGLGHYLERLPDVYHTAVPILPVIGDAVRTYQTFPSYFQRVGDGALAGLGIALAYENRGRIAGAYGRANDAIYRFFSDRWGKAAGYGAQIGTNAGALLVLGRLLNVL